MHKVGITLPNGVVPVEGGLVLEWARRAEEASFSSLAMPDRLTYTNFEPLVTLAAATGATSRIRIVSQSVIAPLRPAPLFAKQVATLAALAQGRLTLGVCVGGRQTDYEAVGVPWKERDNILDAQLEFLKSLSEPADEQALGPRLDPNLEILIGGARTRGTARLVKYGDGYISGGTKPEIFRYEVMATKGAWEAAGKPGTPRIVAGTWFASTGAVRKQADANLERYFVQGAPPDPIRHWPMTGRTEVTEGLLEFFELGADEVILFPPVAELSELEWLAELVAELPTPAPA